MLLLGEQLSAGVSRTGNLLHQEHLNSFTANHKVPQEQIDKVMYTETGEERLKAPPLSQNEDLQT